MPNLQDIQARLAAHDHRELREHEGARAAVAMVLRAATAGPEVLFIERARREGDPWSGHMAFPGGRLDPVDASTRAAAERETLEEVGLSLDDALHIGRLDDKTGNPRTASKLVISAHVYRLDHEPRLEINHEVASAFWLACRMTGPSAVGSENGTWSSITSTPASTIASTMRSESSNDG